MGSYFAENGNWPIFMAKQDKYTMNPGRQIYLSDSIRIFGQNWFLNNKIKKKFQRKNLILQKNWEKQNLGKKIVEKNSLEKHFRKKKVQLQVTIPSAHPVQISRSDYCITLSHCGIKQKKWKKQQSLKKGVWPLLYSLNQNFLGHAVFTRC